MASESGSVLFVGVGGQGVVLASAVAADAARRVGCDVKQSEVHGMSQRGGVVSSHLRFGPEVRSPLIARGEADALVALEWNEALRALPMLKRGGVAIVNLWAIRPPSAFRDRRGGTVAYPAPLLGALGAHGQDVRAFDALAVASHAGEPKAMNSALLGVLSTVFPLSAEAWTDALDANVPAKATLANRAAFRAGQAMRFGRAGKRASTAQASPGVARSGGGAAGDVEILAERCKGEECAICVRACPELCLGFDGATAVRVVRADACTACRLCEIFCPDFAILVRDGVPA